MVNLLLPCIILETSLRKYLLVSLMACGNRFFMISKIRLSCGRKWRSFQEWKGCFK